MLANGFTTGAVALLLAGVQLAAAHMEISYPAPFRSKYNKYATNIDYTNTAPLEASGANYPCKGYQSDLGTAAGTPTASFAAGSQYQFTVVGGAPHGGGSCQVSLSYDKGKTFTVIQSIEGGCPLQSNYTFTVPSDAPSGDAIWAWTWNNEIGNREFYMNCAAVTITGSGSSKRAAELDTRATAFSARPQVFVANLANINTCTVAEGTDVKYPNPGPDVTTSGSKIGAPAGSCGSASSGSSGSSSGSSSSGSSSSGSGAASSSVQATAAPAATSTGLPGGVFLTVASSATSSAAAAAAPTTLATSVASANTPASTGTSSSGSSSSSSGSSSSSSGSTSSAGAYAAGTACSDEGAWNCIAGTSFQRCASGTWSAVQSVAPGTKCAAGVSDSYTVEVATKLRARRLRGSEKRRITADA